jgi:hypothetical protein
MLIGYALIYKGSSVVVHINGSVIIPTLEDALAFARVQQLGSSLDWAVVEVHEAPPQSPTIEAGDAAVPEATSDIMDSFTEAV